MIMLVCLPCCFLLSGLLPSLASVSFRSCEDSFDYVCLSSSWTRSSSLRDFRQDDLYPRYHFYLCLLVASFYRYVALPITCFTMPPKLPCQPLTFSPFLANHCLAMLPLCSAPLIALLVAGEVEDCSMLVFCSTLAALVSVIPVLCSLILHSLRGWVYGNPLTVCFE